MATDASNPRFGLDLSSDVQEGNGPMELNLRGRETLAMSCRENELPSRKPHGFVAGNSTIILVLSAAPDHVKAEMGNNAAGNSRISTVQFFFFSRGSLMQALAWGLSVRSKCSGGIAWREQGAEGRKGELEKKNGNGNLKLLITRNSSLISSRARFSRALSFPSYFTQIRLLKSRAPPSFLNLKKMLRNRAHQNQNKMPPTLKLSPEIDLKTVETMREKGIRFESGSADRMGDVMSAFAEFYVDFDPCWRQVYKMGFPGKLMLSK